MSVRRARQVTTLAHFLFYADFYVRQLVCARPRLSSLDRIPLSVLGQIVQNRIASQGLTFPETIGASSVSAQGAVSSDPSPASV